MSLSEETARVAGGGKDTLKVIIQKMGVTVGSEKIDQYPTLAEKILPAARAVVNVYADTGTQVTMTKGGTSLAATSSGGVATLYPTELGEWSVSYTFKGSKKTKTYTLDSIGIKTVYPFEIGDSLNDTDWANIALCSQYGFAKDVFKIGDVKNLVFDGENCPVQIIGFDHDDLVSGGKAGITFQTVNFTKKTTTSVWNQTRGIRDTLSGYLSSFPSDLRSAIKPVTKKTADKNTGSIYTTQDSLFLLSEIEVTGSTSLSSPGEGSQYDWYKAGNSKLKYYEGVVSSWWLRSSKHGDSWVMDVYETTGSSNPSNTYGAAFAFCM